MDDESGAQTGPCRWLRHDSVFENHLVVYLERHKVFEGYRIEYRGVQEYEALFPEIL
jgi:hypothetical protein